MDDPVPVTALVMPCSMMVDPVPVTALAMPCSPVVPRWKPRFVEVTADDIEEYPVDVEFKDYGYAIQYTKKTVPRDVVRVDGGSNIIDWTTYA
eukprot:9067290-Heterocapsa_arctica.AAC.1